MASPVTALASSSDLAPVKSDQEQDRLEKAASVGSVANAATRGSTPPYLVARLDRTPAIVFVGVYSPVATPAVAVEAGDPVVLDHDVVVVV
jgi:hypothetical protein